MRLQMRGEMEWTEPLRRHAARRLHFALSRFGRSVGLVTVHILHAAGGPESLEKTCAIVVDLLPEGRVDIAETQADLYAAVSRAAERAGRAVGRALDRKHDWDAGRAGAGGGAA